MATSSTTAFRRARWTGWIDPLAVRDAVPFGVSAIPFGFVVGLAITESAMPAWVAWSTNPLVFAGAAQLTVISLAGTASLWALISAGLVINACHVMYSAAMAPAFRRQPLWFRWLGPMLLIDQTFALATARLDDEPISFRRYFLTAGLFLWCNWLAMTGLGMLVGPIVPQSWRLEFAIPIMFLGVVLAGLKQIPHAVAATVGGAAGLVASGLPDRLGILVGAFAGIAAGTVADVWSERRRPPNPSDRDRDRDDRDGVDPGVDPAVLGMSTSTALVVVAILAVATYLMRAGLILLLSEATVPAPVERSLRYVGPAVLAALVVKLAAGGEGGPHVEIAEMLALIGGGATMWWRRNLIVSVIAGMCVLWIVTALS